VNYSDSVHMSFYNYAKSLVRLGVNSFREDTAGGELHLRWIASDLNAATWWIAIEQNAPRR
jgi:hypothetical protein